MKHSSNFQYHQKLQREWFDRHENLQVFTGFTVDPATSRDMDDGLSYRQLDTNLWQVNVAIAQVAAVIPLQSDEYNLAYQNVRSFYYQDKRHPRYMLSAPVTEQLCSLNYHEMKPAVVLQCAIDIKDGTMEASITEGVFQSADKLTYNAFAKRLCDKDAPLYKLTEFVANYRSEMLYPDLDIRPPTVFSEFDPTRFNLAQDVVEEWAKFTNHSFARAAMQNNTPYINRYLTQSAEDPDRYYGVYNCDAVKHDHIGYTPYSHSSSPIRRLPDLCNQYNLTAVMNGLTPPLDIQTLQDIATRGNDMRFMQRSMISRNYADNKFKRPVKQSHLATDQVKDFYKRDVDSGRCASSQIFFNYL